MNRVRCAPLKWYCLTFLLIFALVDIPDAYSQLQDSSSPGLSLVWTKNVAGLRSFSLSARGERLALITTEGKLALWTAQQGVPVWSEPHQTATNVIVSEGDGAVVTYNLRDLVGETVTMRKADTGDILFSHSFGAAVWTAAFSQDGAHAVIGCGDGSLYLYDMANNYQMSHVSLAGTPMSATFALDGKSVFVGLWNESGVDCIGDDGSTVWKAGGDNNRQYWITSTGPKFVTYIGSSNRHGSAPSIYVVHASSGELLWAYNLDNNSFSATAATDDTADSTGVSYAEPRRVQHDTIVEHKLTLIDRSGEPVWEKGGLFWSPTLICMTPDQKGLIVYDGNRTLFRLDSQGRTVAHAFLSDVLRQWSVSADNSSLAVYTHDGQLTLLHIH